MSMLLTLAEIDPVTTVVLAVLCAASLGACLIGMGKHKKNGPMGVGLTGGQRWLVMVCLAGGAVLYAYRVIWVHQAVAPLGAHVDGLLLVAAGLSAAVLYAHRRERVPGFGGFALPVLVVVLAWALCAGSFTFYRYQAGTLWQAGHLAAVYLGTVFFVVSGVAGGMYLYAQRGLRAGRGQVRGGPVASLELLERVMVRGAGLGLVLLTVGLVVGFVTAWGAEARVGPGWWRSAEIVLGVSVWLTFALLVGVQRVGSLRGGRAAWLSLVGVALLFVTFGTATVATRMGQTQSSGHAVDNAGVSIHHDVGGDAPGDLGGGAH